MEIITVYTKNDCPGCLLTKKLLHKEGIIFEEKNINTDPESLNYIKTRGWLGLPVVETTTTSWSGFQPERIKNLVPKIGN